MEQSNYIPGEKVWLRGAIGRERVEIVRVMGGRVRIQYPGGRCRTVGVERIAPTAMRLPIPPSLERAPNRRRPELKPQPKAMPARDKEYLGWLRALPCTFCGQTAQRCEASHHGKHGIGTKPSDHDALPACQICHGRHHQKGSPAPWMDEMTREERSAFFQMRAAQMRARWMR